MFLPGWRSEIDVNGGKSVNADRVGAQLGRQVAQGTHEPIAAAMSLDLMFDAGSIQLD